MWLGNSRHVWMWDYPSMAHRLAEAGFTPEDPVDQHGEFFRRGGVLDVFPADATLPPGIVQLHVLGRFDHVVPPALGEASARRLGGTVLVWREKHTCCWAKRTHRLLALAQPAR